MPAHIPEGSPHEDKVGSYSFTISKHLTYLEATIFKSLSYLEHKIFKKSLKKDHIFKLLWITHSGDSHFKPIYFLLHKQVFFVAPF